MSLRSTILIGSLVVFSACGSSVTMTYTATSSVHDAAKTNQLFQATERVLIRRLAGAEIKGSRVTVIPQDPLSASVTVIVPSAAADTVRRITSEPFTFEIRLDNGTRKDESGHDETDWQPTGVDGSMLDWVQPVQGPNPTDIGVELQFNAAGHEQLAKAFKANAGKDVGIFVRDLLVSKLKVNSAAPGDHILINGIPSAKVAEIFADDVNVGLHIAYTPSK